MIRSVQVLTYHVERANLMAGEFAFRLKEGGSHGEQSCRSPGAKSERQSPT
jgi:hypothetical protein